MELKLTVEDLTFQAYQTNFQISFHMNVEVSKIWTLEYWKQPKKKCWCHLASHKKKFLPQTALQYPAWGLDPAMTEATAIFVCFHKVILF